MDPTNTTPVPYIIYFYFLSLKEGKTHQLPTIGEKMIGSRVWHLITQPKKIECEWENNQFVAQSVVRNEPKTNTPKNFL